MEGYGDKMFQIIHICFSMMLELREKHPSSRINQLCGLEGKENMQHFGRARR